MGIFSARMAIHGKPATKSKLQVDVFAATQFPSHERHSFSLLDSAVVLEIAAHIVARIRIKIIVALIVFTICFGPLLLKALEVWLILCRLAELTRITENCRP